jgi:hypothetical protein
VADPKSIIAKRFVTFAEGLMGLESTVATEKKKPNFWRRGK